MVDNTGGWKNWIDLSTSSGTDRQGLSLCTEAVYLYVMPPQIGLVYDDEMNYHKPLTDKEGIHIEMPARVTKCAFRIHTHVACAYAGTCTCACRA